MFWSEFRQGKKQAFKVKPILCPLKLGKLFSFWNPHNILLTIKILFFFLSNLIELENRRLKKS